MNRQQALNQLRIMQAWHEDFGNGPNADYDAICYAIGVIEEMPEGTDTLIKALEAEHKKLVEMQRALPKQRTGRWERHYSRPNVYADLFWHCSECGYKNNDDYAPTYHKFCPNCGIKMIQTDKTCDCYSDGRCVGTKEIDLCSCGGDKSKCDFYEHVRQ